MNAATKKIFITGASGTMGYATFQEMYKEKPNYNFNLLLLNDKIGRKKFAHYKNDPRVNIVWGDLCNYDDVEKCVKGCDYVLHIGGMVSPAADYYPVKTLKVNVEAAQNIVKAVKAQPNADDIKVVYIGTVAETGDRNAPIHWGRCGDPIKISVYDHYAVSKVRAERIFAESGLKHWVSLRQSGIIYPGIINNMDPIIFHTVLKGVLEWSTVEDSATCMLKVCEDDVPETFWRKFYNISSGPQYRLTNYEFEEKLLFALGMGHDAVKKIFEPNWFITRNFHGQWYTDSDDLENILHFRHNVPVDEYFANIKKGAPWWTNLSFLGANEIGKMGMKMIASNKLFGTLSWLKNRDETRLSAYFGSYEKWEAQPSKWEDVNLERPSEKQTFLNHGYDESKPIEELDINDMKEAAKFRGGECISETMTKGDLFTPLKWKCALGHEFTMSPNLILKGGHWCPECDPLPWNYDQIAKVNPFFAQVWYPLHDKDEDNIYTMDIYNKYKEFTEEIKQDKKKKNVNRKTSTNSIIYFIFIFVFVIILTMKFTLNITHNLLL